MASVAYDIYRHPALMCTIECTSDVYVCKHLGCVRLNAPPMCMYVSTSVV